MTFEELQEICRVLVNDDVGVGNMDSESVGQIVFSFLMSLTLVTLRDW